jgi:mono/diheme cytochrome c family protein
MSMHKRLPAPLLAASLLAASLLLAAGNPASAQLSPGLGVPVSPEDVAAWALTILPDGTGLPDGSGTPARGMAIYQQKCLACHGAEGGGGPNDRLVGGHGTIRDAAPVKTVGSYWPYATTIFDYVRRAMPLLEPQSLTNDETYALTAYLLLLNGIIETDAVMNARTLPSVEMPNADNFFWAYEPPSE